MDGHHPHVVWICSRLKRTFYHHCLRKVRHGSNIFSTDSSRMVYWDSECSIWCQLLSKEEDNASVCHRFLIDPHQHWNEFNIDKKTGINGSGYFSSSIEYRIGTPTHLRI